MVCLVAEYAVKTNAHAKLLSCANSIHTIIRSGLELCTNVWRWVNLMVGLTLHVELSSYLCISGRGEVIVVIVGPVK